MKKLYDEDGVEVASTHPANADDVEFVLNQDVGMYEGRSDFEWVRLSSGELMLGVWPRGDAYIEVTEKLEI